MKKLDFKLTDNGEVDGEVTGSVQANENYVDISIDGFKSAGGNDAITLELYEGKLMLRVWDDPEKEDYSYTIDLAKVLEEHKRGKDA